MLNGSLSEAEEDDVANLLNLDATEEYRQVILVPIKEKKLRL